VNSSALLERMNFSLALAGNRLSKGITVDWLSQLGATSLQQPQEQERQIENLILHGQISDKTRDLILQQLAAVAPPSPSQPGGAQPIAIAGGAPPKPPTPSQALTPAQQHQFADREAAVAAGLLFGSPDFQRR
jgi:hypothetical protein